MDRQVFLKYHDELARFGLELAWQADGSVLLKTLPQLLPQLDIKKLRHLIENTLAEPLLLQQLVSCQAFDAYQLTQEDKELFCYFLQDQLQQRGGALPGCAPLDAEKCRELLYV